MKFIILISLTTTVLSIATNQSFESCLQNSNIQCNPDCKAEINMLCGQKSAVGGLQKCRFLQDSFNQPSSPEEPWSEQYGVNFHGCYKACLLELEDEQAVNYQETVKQCFSSNLFSSIFLILILIFTAY